MPTDITTIKPVSKESSITVAVRVRPFTSSESARLIVPKNDDQLFGDGAFSSNELNRANVQTDFRHAPRGVRKIVNVVDEKMLIFDPADNNPIQRMQQSLFPNSTSRAREHKFTFDRLFDEDASQEDVYYNTTKPLLDSVLDGYNATVFAYGATGCGKTHTITGTPEKPGIIFATTKELFERIDSLKDVKTIEVSMSYLEIYNETIRDLLNPETESKLLTIREDADHRISVRNLSAHRLTTVDEIMELIIQGNSNRSMNSTEANATSSRSHAVIQINIDQKDRASGLKEEHFYATLSIIDLAGSERASATKNRGKRLHEGANINRSLLALGNCINALCDPRRRNHVPYRDSKLTRLLKFSLGGNCKTVMIVCISPSSQHYDETLNTLKYANRAKEIKTKVIRNTHNLDRHVGSYLKMITEQKQEIEDLRSREQRVIEQKSKEIKHKRDKCVESLIQAIDRLKSAIHKHEIEIFKKSKLLVKRRILCLQKLEVSLFLKSFYTNYGSKFVDTPRDLADVKSSIKSLIIKLDKEMSHVDTLLSRDNEIELIFNKSARLSLQTLKEMDEWTDHDTFIYESLVEGLRNDVDKKIFSHSNSLWDSLIARNGEQISSSFNFLSDSFFKVFKKLTFINTSNDVEIVRDENLSLINGMLNDCYDLLNNNMGFDNIEKHLAFDDLEKITGEKRLPSPIRINLSPHKTLRNNHSSKVKSPNHKTTFKSKKVRWDLPANTAISPVKDDNEDTSLDEDDDQEEPVDSEALLDDSMNDYSKEFPVMDTKFSFQLDFPKRFSNYQSPSESSFLSIVEKEKAQDQTNIMLDSNHDNKSHKPSLTEMTLKPNTDSDLSRLSLDNSMLFEKENYSLDLKDSFDGNTEPTCPQPQKQLFPIGGLFALHKNERKLNIGPPRRLGKVDLEPDRSQVEIPEDKFNFEANLSGDIQMSDVSND